MKQENHSSSDNGNLADTRTTKWSYVATSQSLFAKLFRFGGVGALTGLIYVVIVAILVDGFDVPAKWASALGYIGALPANFLAHKNITFRSDKPTLVALVRFVILHATNIIVSIACMYLVVDWLEYSYWIGSVLVVAMVPISTFVVMDLWVFSRSASESSEVSQQP